MIQYFVIEIEMQKTVNCSQGKPAHRQAMAKESRRNLEWNVINLYKNKQDYLGRIESEKGRIGKRSVLRKYQAYLGEKAAKVVRAKAVIHLMGCFELIFKKNRNLAWKRIYHLASQIKMMDEGCHDITKTTGYEPTLLKLHTPMPLIFKLTSLLQDQAKSARLLKQFNKIKQRAEFKKKISSMIRAVEIMQQRYGWRALCTSHQFKGVDCSKQEQGRELNNLTLSLDVEAGQLEDGLFSINQIEWASHNQAYGVQSVTEEEKYLTDKIEFLSLKLKEKQAHYQAIKEELNRQIALQSHQQLQQSNLMQSLASDDPYHDLIGVGGHDRKGISKNQCQQQQLISEYMKKCEQLQQQVDIGREGCLLIIKEIESGRMEGFDIAAPQYDLIIEVTNILSPAFSQF